MINKARIKENLEEISFPRLSGTEGEVNAFNLLEKKLLKKNLTPYIQEFRFSTFYSRFYPKLIFSLASWLLFWLFIDFSGLFMFINIFVVSIFYIILFLIAKNPEKIKLGKLLPSRNLILKIPPKLKNNEDKYIIFLAHVDSKSQRYSILTRIWSIRIWVYSFILGLLMIIFNNLGFSIFNFYFYLISFISLCINFCAIIVILLNTTSNKSLGASDNGSGVVCVLELLFHYLKPEFQLNNNNLCFVFTGAEECGTMGIRHFYNNIKEIDRKNIMIINFDAIGKELAYFSNLATPKKNILLYNKILSIAEKLSLKFQYAKRSIGVRTDGIYLMRKSFVGFGFGDLEVYKYVHLIHDTIDKVDINLLEKLCIFLTFFLKEIDN